MKTFVVSERGSSKLEQKTMNNPKESKPPALYVRASRELYDLVTRSAEAHMRSLSKEAQALIRLGLECEKLHEHDR